MNLLFIIPALGGGGAERTTVSLANDFSNIYNVIVVTYYEDTADYDLNDNIKVYCLNTADGKNIFQKIYNSLKRIISIRKIKSRMNIDCCISMLVSPNFENVLSRVNEKTIVSIRNKESVELGFLYKRINKYTCKLADHVVALSKSVMNDQIVQFNTPVQKIETIYNPCDLELIRMRADEKILDEAFERIIKKAKTLFITAGRLSDQKGQWHLIRAFSLVTKEVPNACLVILGRGDLDQYLQQLIDDYGLQNNVFILGFKKNPYWYMKRSDVFVFSSLYEGFGNILLEAMGCGLPIISTDCDAGPRELLAPNSDLNKRVCKIEYEEFGILVPCMDGIKYSSQDELSSAEVFLANSMIFAVNNASVMHEYAKKSGERIKDFCPEIIHKEWEKLINLK